MKKIIFVCFAVLACFSMQIFAQIPTNTLVEIVRAEDELRYDKTLESLMQSADAKIRARAALAAGRIGNESAVPVLTGMLEKDPVTDARTMAAFALGEIESLKGADAIIKILQDTKAPDAVRARAIEAAGKIAAANSKNENAKILGETILKTMSYENTKGSTPNTNVVLLGLTAILRARPAGADTIVRTFLAYTDGRIRSDALNTLTRLRAQNSNRDARDLLVNDINAVVRANAARVLGAAVDKDSFDALLNAAVNDADSRVRVSAIRSLGSLQDAKAADKLLERAAKLIADYKKSKFTHPVEKNELLEIATVLGRLLPNSNNDRAVKFLTEFRTLDSYESPEIEISFAQISPGSYTKSLPVTQPATKDAWRQISSVSQGLAELAKTKGKENTSSSSALEGNPEDILRVMLGALDSPNAKFDNTPAIPDVLRAYAQFKPGNLDETARKYVRHKDVIVRTAAAEILGDAEPTQENISALSNAFLETENDKLNDASLAVLDALGKQYSKLRPSNTSTLPLLKQFQYALDSPDYLVRRKAIAILSSLNLMGDITSRFELVRFPSKQTNLASELRSVRANYAQAVSRKNGQIKAVVATEKGIFTIDLLPEDAPLTIDNFIKLAKSGYFNGLSVHRVVPNFVMQDGDPRGDGNGGPGWVIRCEVNMLSYDRGAVGMALSGKDTGGSQWFITHSPQPHLDGGYTIFGHVNETDMKIVDQIVRGDKILSIRIVENNALMPKTGSKQKPKSK